MEEKAQCRNCKKELNGKPYYMGGSAYDYITKKQCKVNYYGGYVCCETCDLNASLELERSMPGHGNTQNTLSGASKRHFNNNWK